MTAEEARKIANKVETQKKEKKWNTLDALQLAWFEMWIKYHAKRGKTYMYSFFAARSHVVEFLREKKGYRLGIKGPGTLIFW